MFKGTVVMEDHTIMFNEAPVREEDNRPMMEVTVIDTFENKSDTSVVPQDQFFKALAIAVHPDGMPDANKDYPEAEQAMGSIRWIP